ncbi:two-component system, LytT family, response regulator [Pseudoalteromonas sp. BSi20311]|jgi:two-component system LytT family response regulator|uniref:LytR/AlgR family response regulator transcription factor n=1 Tax=Pseudoalteromonas sp. BSi20311 TaxID=383911 RepID=UPI0002319C8B|nr:LytTR family DNA-binding domain-containing protein [Pseudoalteromonas sp. BSi20311]GAA63729.1 two-component system, LytT family, response regulator [Pseudoalteromonas sp. BSi20311]HCP97667.1 DNA-binding response regulator [Pseudoalteromonas sp.]|tara:strand:+ start:5399 stop:6193 length:795 start_codon:yes stop_codon:yes gene_type:complete
MMRLKTLLVDDEYSAIEGLRIRLEAFDEIDVISSAQSVDEAINILNKHDVDLVFLDIEMPTKSGFELIKHFQPESCPAVIFVTAFHQHAVKAFEVRALDYLLKPVKLDRLAEAIDRVINTAKLNSKNELIEVQQSLVKNDPDEIAVSANSDYKFEAENLVIQDAKNPIQIIPFKDILWIDAAGDYMCVHTLIETYVMRARLKDLEKNTLPEDFLRIHKSTIVNLSHIKQLNPLRNSEYMAVLDNEKNLKVSRTYSKNLKSLIKQ